MRLTNARVKNYKSFSETNEVRFAERFTVLVGQNNSGKTAFLDSLNPNTFRNVPHRVPSRGAFPSIINPNSEIEYEVTLSGPELEHAMKLRGGQYSIPVPGGLGPDQTKQFLEDMFRRDHLVFKLKHPAQAGWDADFPAHRLFRAESVHRTSARVDIDPSHQNWSTATHTTADSLPSFLGKVLAESFYGFRAERLSIAQSPINESSELAPNASNLPSVMLQLPKRHSAHTLYQQYVREIFPNIFWIGSRPVSSNIAEIEVSMNDALARPPRAGVTVSLTESGTGVGQVLALLYVIVTADFPRIIAIDEPNSFLHPGAAKKLIAILKKFDHQYIISTHSADLIRISDPDYVHLIEWEETESKFRSLDHSSIEDQRKILSEIGVSLSDVFGSDSVLWVEGPTEERCFPLILEHLGIPSAAVSITSIVATDDLSSKRPRAKLAWDIYEKLSTGSALVPPALAFALDREDRTEKEMEDLVRASRGRVKFLPRRTYENYLVDADAITAVLSQLLGVRFTTQAVTNWIDAKQSDRKYLEKELVEGQRWDYVVNAPALLSDLFNELSDARIEYRKTTHSVELTKWLLTNKGRHLDELFEFIRRLTSDVR